jgi:hypothetical protein
MLKRKICSLFLCLALAGLIGLTLLVVSQAAARLKIPTPAWADYQWGTYNGNREASRLGREEIVAREDYCFTSGCVLRLDGVEVRPNRCRGGQTVVLSTTYTILTPDAVAIPVSINRDILFQGHSLGQTRHIETRKLNGTWVQEVDFTLPATAKAWTYTLKTKVSTGYGLDQKSLDFQVY